MPRRISIAAKFFFTYFVITGIALAFAGTAGYLLFKGHAIEEADRHLLTQAHLVAEVFRPLLTDPEGDPGTIAREGDRIGRDLDTRLTVILPDGRVAADSALGAARIADMGNEADRAEVRTALAGQPGVSQRRSIVRGEEYRYAAVPVVSEGRIAGIARTSIPASLLNRRLDRIRAITWATGFAAFLLMLAGTAVRARHVTGPLAAMRQGARDLASGNLRTRVHVRTGDELEDMGQAMNHMAERLERTVSQRDVERARLATILENLAEGVIVIAEGRTVRMMNREAARILGTPGIAAEGRPCAELIRHPDVLAFIDRWRKSEAVPPREVVVPARPGHLTMRLSGTVVRHPGEKEADLLLTLRDVTEEKRLSRMKSDFVSNASHELRTPLTNIRGYIEAAQDASREGMPADPSFLAVAHENALRMERLIDDLLELSRAESGRALTIEEVRLPAFLDRVAALHRPEAERRGKALIVECDDVPFRADPEKLALVLSNLVDNAVKYGIDEGRITLRGRSADGGTVLEVADDGPGIAPEHLPRIFERFYRIDKGRSRELGGTGLGLSIAKHIVESHGGTIRAESRLGIGTRFIVRLPERQRV
jgi:two-component system, OmpR family, phosphate regulon sensor histidine kinase PhoR